ncbi:uncharacterized protein [Clytia hemisphaerica]|uniref:SWIM-type domain-containing protein n=2 Tax=Clytia hemisphaerica TaxID=252671 RepID=A0A7M5V489_9CNID
MDNKHSKHNSNGILLSESSNQSCNETLYEKDITLQDDSEQTDSCNEDSSLSSDEKNNLGHDIPSHLSSPDNTSNKFNYIMTMEEVNELREYVISLRQTGDDIVSLKIEDIENERISKFKGNKNPQNQGIYLFHQSEMQQYLLNKYGSVLFIKEIKQRRAAESNKLNNFSLFLICVRTNLDCQVVSLILTNQLYGFSKALKQGLLELQLNNGLWQPKYLMIDPLQHVIDAVQEVFPGVAFFFNQSGCLQETEEYLSLNLIENSEEDTKKLFLDLNQMLERTTKSAAFLDLVRLKKKKATNLEENLKWFSTHPKKWLQSCFPDDLSCLLQYDWLREVVNLYRSVLMKLGASSYYGIVPVVKQLTQELPKYSYQRYATRNQRHFKNNQLVLKYHPSLEKDLGLPLFMIDHVKQIVDEIIIEDQVTIVECYAPRKFEVTNQSNDNAVHLVNLGTQTTFPSCTCLQWKNKPLPCQHMFKVFAGSLLGYKLFKPYYRLNSYFQIDYSCVKMGMLSTKSHYDNIFKTKDELTSKGLPECSKKDLMRYGSLYFDVDFFKYFSYELDQLQAPCVKVGSGLSKVSRSSQTVEKYFRHSNVTNSKESIPRGSDGRFMKSKHKNQNLSKECIKGSSKSTDKKPKTNPTKTAVDDENCTQTKSLRNERNNQPLSRTSRQCKSFYKSREQKQRADQMVKAQRLKEYKESMKKLALSSGFSCYQNSNTSSNEISDISANEKLNEKFPQSIMKSTLLLNSKNTQASITRPSACTKLTISHCAPSTGKQCSVTVQSISTQIKPAQIQQATSENATTKQSLPISNKTIPTKVTVSPTTVPDSIQSTVLKMFVHTDQSLPIILQPAITNNVTLTQKSVSKATSSTITLPKPTVLNKIQPGTSNMIARQKQPVPINTQPKVSKFVAPSQSLSLTTKPNAVLPKQSLPIIQPSTSNKIVSPKQPAIVKPSKTAKTIIVLPESLLPGFASKAKGILPILTSPTSKAAPVHTKPNEKNVQSLLKLLADKDTPKHVSKNAPHSLKAVNDSFNVAVNKFHSTIPPKKLLNTNGNHYQDAGSVTSNNDQIKVFQNQAKQVINKPKLNPEQFLVLPRKTNPKTTNSINDNTLDQLSSEEITRRSQPLNPAMTLDSNQIGISAPLQSKRKLLQPDSSNPTNNCAGNIIGMATSEISTLQPVTKHRRKSENPIRRKTDNTSGPLSLDSPGLRVMNAQAIDAFIDSFEIKKR